MERSSESQIEAVAIIESLAWDIDFKNKVSETASSSSAALSSSRTSSGDENASASAPKGPSPS